ncbi:MAG: cell wall-active antibiotics response protein [Dehalococcoidia bacterium]|nr:cell wall-active antibiotics response protein [Dehalococcoidia bacterium]
MSWRAKDVLPLSIAAYLVALGGLYLLDSLGIRSYGVAGSIGVAVGLAFIWAGILAFIAAWRVRRFARRLRRAIGHVRSDLAGWAVDDAVVSTVLGDISLDLRQADLPEGETQLTLLCWLGTIQVRVPDDVGLDVTAQTMVGSVEVLGRREEGFVRDIHVRSEAYEGQPKRLQMRLSTFVGELLVVHG